MARKTPGGPRGNQLECTCAAYPFRHRLGGGKCTGEEWVIEHRLHGDQTVCYHCPENMGMALCAPADGRESFRHCKHYQEQMLEKKG